MHRSFYILLVIFGLLALSACDSTNNSGSPVAGRYEATTLVAKTDTGTVDMLQRGVYIEMTLQQDNTVEDGVMFVPAEFTEEDVDGSREITFAGTWARPSDNTVTFDHEADTFIRDTEWTYEEDTLQTETGEVIATLHRQTE